MNIRKKKLPMGIENFEKMRTEDFYYVDKTGLIRELLYNWGEVTLFTRPRRFGKSLNMSMLKKFLELGGNKEIFQGLKISRETELCEKYMGKFPVISISLKSVEGNDFGAAYAMLCMAVGKEALRFSFLSESEELSDKEKDLYEQITTLGEKYNMVFAMDETVLAGSLHTLSMLLEKHYRCKVIVLIDEYDVPLAKAFEHGYYDRMSMLIRKLFDQALKTNDSLKFAVVTGCMRISKESIFTGLNNLKVLSIADVRFDEYFGFTDREVRDMLDYYELSGSYEKVKAWYDGYQFGNVNVYCPWDVINYCDALRWDPDAQPQNYWVNTSSNDVVKRFIQKAGKGMTKREIERLTAGEAITKEIHQELTYKDMYNSIDNIWSVLFTTGYLTQRGRADGCCFHLTIPNMEIREIFTRQIMEYFKENVQKDGEALDAFCRALQNGDAKGVEKQLGEYLRKTISIRDTFVRKQMKENFYHGILLGILGFKDEWGVSSNRESGDGYSDILVEIEDEGTGIVIEVKYAEEGKLESGCREALKQVEENQYDGFLRDEGIEKVLKYGIACYRKRCKVVLGD